ncbi:MAG: hypothetical protein K5919_01085, partial [Clostridiales bacterium]|nr:hypothetical protein [Clostridiales bacterium]
ANIYCQSEDGAYFLFELPISQEDYDKLVPGTKIRVKGYKSEWSGEVEIVDAAVEVIEGEPFFAEAEDVTALLGTDDLIKNMNKLVAFKGMTVEAYDETGAAFAYKDASGKTDDLYFKVSKDGVTYDFCVEFYLRGNDTEVYKAVEGLKVGDVVDLEGYLYWYNGPNPHIISVKAVEAAAEAAPAEPTKAEEPAAEPEKAEEPAVMSYAEYEAAEKNSEVTVETYVQDKQGWWQDKANIYCQSEDGAYFLFELPISQEDYDKLVPGTKIRVKGYKSEWSGEVEIIDATVEVIEGEPFIAEAEDVTALLGTDDLIKNMNKLVAFKGMTVEAYDETGAAFAYKDASGKTDDLYFKVSKDGVTYDFCVEFYLRGSDTEVYKAVEGLKVGDVVDLEGYLYWYNGANPHIISVKAAE